MTETETSSGWLSREQLREARERLPILYVEVVQTGTSTSCLPYTLTVSS